MSTFQRAFQERKSKSDGSCFAIVKPLSSTSTSGIYFSLEEAKKQVIYHRSSKYESFAKVSDADKYLKGLGLFPVDDGGWISTKRKNIMVYKWKQQKKQKLENACHESIIEDFKSSSNPNSKQKHKQKHKQSQQKPKRQRKNNYINFEEEDNDDDTGDRFQGKSNRIDLTSNTSPPETPAPFFDETQQSAIDEALVGKNVFITGVAGTGKSCVLKKIIEDAKLFNKEVAVAAPTGVAAVNLGAEFGAQTIHSLAGIGVPQTASDFRKLLAPWNVRKWRKIDTLVVDEIGMLSADFLDWLDVYVRKARANPLKAFGGIQLIFCGDFAQLGPIPGNNSLTRKAYDKDEPAADCMLSIRECVAYAFQSILWREAHFYHVRLKNVYRQKNVQFQLALMDVREAKADSERVRNLVDACCIPLDERDELQIPSGIKPTILYSTNQNVDKENNENLRKLRDEGKSFEAEDSTSLSRDVSIASRDVVGKTLARNAFFNDCPASKKIHLKRGAQVMLLKNLDLKQGLVNGSRGVVESFKLCPVVKAIINGEERLIGPSDIEKFPGFRYEDLKYGQKADFEGKIWRICRFDKYPLVRFLNNVTQIIVPELFERVLYRQGKCIRRQIPLRLAWALTIHKAQGATLDFLVCDLKGAFTSGQIYVALSRARSLEGLQIKNFNPTRVTADTLVEAFYNALENQNLPSFLEKAGLWFYPILKVPTWLDMFTKASSKYASDNAQQFRSWVQEYKPLDD